MIFKAIKDLFNPPKRSSVLAPRHAWYGGEDGDSFIRPTSERGWLERYDIMTKEHPLVGAFIGSLSSTLSQVAFHIKTKDQVPEEEEMRLKRIFLEWSQGSLKDFTHTFLMTYLYGFSCHIITLDKSKDGYKVHSLEPIHPLSAYPQASGGELLAWSSSDHGGEIFPLSRLVYARSRSGFTSSCYGESILRPVYPAYHRQLEVYKDERLAMRNNMAGISVFRYDDTGNEEEAEASFNRVSEAARLAGRGAIKSMVQPSSTHMNQDGNYTGNPKESVEIIGGQGSKTSNATEVINRETMTMAQGLMAQFLIETGTANGSFSRAKENSNAFKSLTEGILSHMVDTLNAQLITPLWVVNGGAIEDAPYLEYDSPQLSIEALGTIITQFASSGLPIQTKAVTEYAFNMAGIPVPSDEEMIGGG